MSVKEISQIAEIVGKSTVSQNARNFEDEEKFLLIALGRLHQMGPCDKGKIHFIHTNLLHFFYFGPMWFEFQL